MRTIWSAVLNLAAAIERLSNRADKPKPEPEIHFHGIYGSKPGDWIFLPDGKGWRRLEEEGK